jgi:pimeloyl-ACP methyl ester carboxylesterase
MHKQRANIRVSGKIGRVHAEAILNNDHIAGILYHPEHCRFAGAAVFVHGAASDCLDGLPHKLSYALALRGIPVLNLNLWGRGLGRYDSSLRKLAGWPWHSPQRATHQVEEAIHYLQGLHQRVAVIGHSWGALLASMAAGQADFLVLISPFANSQVFLTGLYLKGFEKAQEQARAAIGEGRPRATVPTAPGATIPFLSAETLIEYQDHDFDLRRILSSSEVPRLVVVGGKEHSDLVDHARALGNSGSGSFKLLSEAAHFYRGYEEPLGATIAHAIGSRWGDDITMPSGQ